ncbi:MAG TPA: hypothetical protein VFL65_08550 [Jatrophihabitans sp.]|nr:hypothetical protein [Jatrophihabitans sp.]
MNKLGRTLAACAAAATAVLGLQSAAGASPASPQHTHHHAKTCAGTGFTSPGLLTSGTYYGVNVSGFCMVPSGAHVLVLGNVNIGTAGTLFAITSNTMTVHGNVHIGRAAILALGCSAGLGCDGANGNPPPSKDTVYGNVTGVGALAMYLNGDTVRGNVAFIWGGWGPMCTDPNADLPTDPLGHDLVVKDNTFNGSVTLYGYSGCWLGFLRNKVHGRVIIANNYANPANVITDVNPPEDQGLDSTEVVANTIWGSLSCWGNTPKAQFGDAVLGAPPGYGPNTVHGRVTGECRSLVRSSSS